jgi:hypothetical protein
MTGKELYFGGVPVGPDVDRLDVEYQELTHEQVLTHEELSGAIGYSIKSSRYRTVVTAWRKRLFDERGIELQAVRGLGLRVMTNSQRIDSHIDKAVGGLKAVVRAGARLAVVPRHDVPAHVAKRADHAQLFIAKLGPSIDQFKTSVRLPGAADTMPARHDIEPEKIS